MENGEFFSHSLCLDFRALSLQHVTDFVFICHPSLITVFAITSLPVASDSQVRAAHEIRGYNDRLLEIKLTPALIQKLQGSQGRDEAKDRLAIKENISAVNFLPPVSSPRPNSVGSA
jgi:hypothetical protein